MGGNTGDIELRSIISPDDPVLVTGAGGFIGPVVVEKLLQRGFRNIRAFVKPSSDLARLEMLLPRRQALAQVRLIKGNLLCREDCAAAADGVAVILHLAMGADKSFAGAFMNTVVTTRNLLEASLQCTCLKRFVNVSSFAVYANTGNSRQRWLDERSPVEKHAERYGDAYRFAKIRQEQVVAAYGRQFGIPYVTVRPGSVLGPGKAAITGRVGIDTFGFFLHLGGWSRIPFTYIDNCACAIVLAGLMPGIDGEIFNIVDDDLPTSRYFLRHYKRRVRRFPSLYVPHFMSYALCTLWEKYSKWSDDQLPPAFNRSRWHAEWKNTHYSNQKLKLRLGWRPEVPMQEALARYFNYCREAQHA